jgi:hypothetical protein
MKNLLHIIGKVLLSLILIMPILGTPGVFPPPTPDLYNTALAFAFIEVLMEVGYIDYMMTVVHVIALVALWGGREALAALIITPITANVVGFHLFIDGGLLTGGAVVGNIMLALNLYLLWINRQAYESLWVRSRPLPNQPELA